MPPRDTVTSPHELLLRLARLALTEEDRAAIRARAAGADWAAILELARRGGVAGMVARHIEAEHLPVPADVRRRLAALALQAEARGRVQLAEARRLCAAAGTRGLTLIPLKGAALLLEGVYGDPSLRSMVDVDLLTRRDEVDALAGLLASEGYEPLGEPEGYLRWYHHLAFIRRVTGVDVIVELHWTALHVMYSRPAVDAVIVARSRVVTVDGVLMRGLDPAARLLAVALHVAVHRYRAGLKWLVDVSELARAAPGDLEWDWLWRTARGLGARRALAYVFALARELLDAPLPEQPLPPPLWALRAVCPAGTVVASASQPGLPWRLLINLLQYDSPAGPLGYALHKGAELLERTTGIARPSWLARRNLLRR
jgi:hypothetical protein